MVLFNSARNVIYSGSVVQWLTCQSVTLEIAGSSPVRTANFYAPLDQLDRSFGYGPKGQGFKSSTVRHFMKYQKNILTSVIVFAIISIAYCVITESSLAWQSAWFGTRRSQVQILSFRPAKLMQVQFNGRTSAFQADYVGSIPITCSRL